VVLANWLAVRGASGSVPARWTRTCPGVS